MVRGRKQRGQDFGSCPPPPTPRRHQGWRPASAWESTSFRFLSGLRVCPNEKNEKKLPPSKIDFLS